MQQYSLQKIANLSHGWSLVVLLYLLVTHLDIEKSLLRLMIEESSLLEDLLCKINEFLSS